MAEERKDSLYGVKKTIGTVMKQPGRDFISKSFVFRRIFEVADMIGLCEVFVNIFGVNDAVKEQIGRQDFDAKHCDYQTEGLRTGICRLKLLI